MTPAEREALPPLDIPQGVHGYPFCDCDLVGGDNTCKIQPPYMSPIEHARKVIEQRERQLLAKMSLISTLELTLSNATKVGVLQMERIDALKASGKWISVQDRMPDVSELPVLAYASGYPDIFAEHNGRKVVHSLARSYNWGSRITHWQPLPAPPPEPIPEEKK